MSDAVFSDEWYRVASLTPRVRSQIQVFRHRYRGLPWYVLHDPVSGRQHRLNHNSYVLLGLMDGERTLEQVWLLAAEKLGDELPGQDEVIRLMGNLYQAGLIQTEAIPDIDDLYQRRQKHLRSKVLAWVKSPLSIKLPLLDIDAFVSRLGALSRWLFSPLAAMVWLVAVVWLAAQSVIHWQSLSEALGSQVLATENLLLMALVYPVLKLIHEFGHALAVKRWGGEVHELGLMFLVFIPVPYVDASHSAAFESKYRRIVVAAAGIMVELAIAALAMWVYLHAEPGVVRALAFNVLLIATVSTLLFNGNPLLRFDAYYVLSDAVEIPNLAARGPQYIGWWLRRHALGLEEPDTLSASASEARWLVAYAVLSFCYRIFITLGIALFVASEFLALGVALALWSLFNVFVAPAFKVLRYLVRHYRSGYRRERFGVVALGVSLLVVCVVFWLPVPNRTLAHGVVWADEDRRVVIRSAGVIASSHVEPGALVGEGDLLLSIANPETIAEARRLRGRLRELEMQLDEAAASREVEAQILRDELALAEQEFRHAREQQAALEVVSKRRGIYQPVLELAPEGMFLPRGSLVGYVVDQGETKLRVVVDHDIIERFALGIRSVGVRLASDTGVVYPGVLSALVPQAQRELPDLALSVEGGGDFALDPASTPEAPLSYRPVFQVDVEMDSAGAAAARIGERAYVLFEHPPASLASLLFQRVRRTFLRELEF